MKDKRPIMKTLALIYRNFFQKTILVLMLLFLAGCAPQPIELRHTLDDWQLEAVETLTSDQFDFYEVNTVPDEDFSRFTRVMITPVTLRLPQDEWRQLTDRDLRRLFRYFTDAFNDVLGEVELSNSPDEATLIVNTYITKVVPSDPERNFFPFIIGELDLGAASFESEAIDVTGRLVATARGTYNGTPLIEGYSTWDVVGHAVNEWLKNVKALLRQGGLLPIPQ